MAGLLDNLLKNLSDPQTLGVLGSRLMAAGAPGANAWGELAKFYPALQEQKDAGLNREYQTLRTQTLRDEIEGKKRLQDAFGGGQPNVSQPQSGASLMPGENSISPNTNKIDQGTFSGVPAGMFGGPSSGSGNSLLTQVDPSIRPYVAALMDAGMIEPALNLLTENINTPHYETVTNPYGESMPGVGQKNTRTGQITDFQKPAEPDRRVLGNQFVEFGPDGKPKVLYSAPQTGGSPVSYQKGGSVQLPTGEVVITRFNPRTGAEEYQGAQGWSAVPVGSRPTANAQTRPLPSKTVTDLAKAGSQVQDFERLQNNFQDDYGGNLLLGGFENTLRRLSPGGDPSGQAQWWQDYQAFTNVLRNQLFGSALTATEKAEFEKAVITPRMSSEEIRKNLQRQYEISVRAAQKMAKAFAASGYDKDAIEGALGIPLEQIDQMGQAARPALSGIAPELGGGGGKPRYEIIDVQ